MTAGKPTPGDRENVTENSSRPPVDGTDRTGELRHGSVETPTLTGDFDQAAFLDPTITARVFRSDGDGVRVGWSVDGSTAEGDFHAGAVGTLDPDTAEELARDLLVSAEAARRE